MRKLREAWAFSQSQTIPAVTKATGVTGPKSVPRRGFFEVDFANLGMKWSSR
jgi:hypothetical protein